MKKCRNMNKKFHMAVYTKRETYKKCLSFGNNWYSCVRIYSINNVNCYF